ncbi:MAG: replication-associated recombination protein A [Anaeroplasmataceae bacterium]
MNPIAYKVRPKTFEEVIGQDHLVGSNGVIRKMIDNNNLTSIILYGKPGTGKTTIASIIKSYYKDNCFNFNASTDNKQMLKDIINTDSIFYDFQVLIIDEIHRMKKDIQDFLLPYLESGKVKLIGLTTENPYISINPAIRSRCHIYKLNPIIESDLIELLKKVNNDKVDISDDIYEYILQASNLEIRTALNILELIYLIDLPLTIEKVVNITGIKSLNLDNKGDNYYDILSAFQKSIRGSDVDASLHYLARLIVLGDLEIICRRLAIIAYEDIGLASPQIGPRVMAAISAAKLVGFPEARIPLSNITIELALSAKSNTGESSIDKALADLEKFNHYEIPKHILNSELKGGKVVYKYPHDYEDGVVTQQYMPDSLKNRVYYEAKNNSQYEQQLAKRNNEFLKPILNKKLD